LSSQGVNSPSLLIHGRVGLDRVRGHARAHGEPRELGVSYIGGVGHLSCARGSCISCSSGGIHRGVHDIECTITLNSLPFIVVL
jgi:hypothetical protein